MFQVHTIPADYGTFTDAAEAAGLEHSGRIEPEGDVLASAMVWLGDRLIAYVAYTTGQDTIVTRSIQSDEIDTLTVEQAVAMIEKFTARR